MLVFDMSEITRPLPKSLPASGWFLADVRPLTRVLVLMLYLIDFEIKLLLTKSALKLFLFDMESIIVPRSTVWIWILLVASFVHTVVHIPAFLGIWLAFHSFNKRHKSWFRSVNWRSLIRFLMVHMRLVQIL